MTETSSLPCLGYDASTARMKSIRKKINFGNPCEKPERRSIAENYRSYPIRVNRLILKELAPFAFGGEDL
jgi:hypothetical protein